jgi:hypothetical protein
MSEIISASRFNEIQGRIASILGTGSGDKGYNNPVNSKAVPIGDVVEATDINLLYDDFEAVYVHQGPDGRAVAILPTEFSRVTTSDLIAVDTATGLVQLEKTWGAYESMATQLETNRFLIAGDQDAIESSGINSSRVSSWGGSGLVQSINHTFTVNFGTPNARRGFFNAGGLIQLSARHVHTYTTGDLNYEKNENWTTILANMGTINFGRAETENGTGTGTGSAIGNLQLTSGYQTVFVKAGTAIYTDNQYYIQARLANDYTIEFNIVLEDGDVGTDGGDEFVLGTTSSFVSHKRADGSYVNNPAPAYIKTSDL